MEESNKYIKPFIDIADLKAYEKWYQQMLNKLRIPKEMFGERDKTYEQIENEKLWAKIRRKS